MPHEIAAFNAFESLTMSITQRLVKRHEPFQPFPMDDGNGGKIVGWLRSLTRKGISQQAATAMLNEDLHEAMGALRARIAATGHDHLGSARAAVLLYLALLPGIGADRVLSWAAMWSALSAGRWDDAADALLMTEWPAVMVGSPAEIARGVALQRVIRTGRQFDADDERRIRASGAPH
jgi:hypothetical protein